MVEEEREGAGGCWRLGRGAPGCALSGQSCFQVPAVSREGLGTGHANSRLGQCLRGGWGTWGTRYGSADGEQTCLAGSETG